MNCVEWGVATRTLPGESKTGDQPLVCPSRSGTLVVALDALGHGEGAASTGQAAVSTLEENAGEHVISLVQRCHEALRRTRGIVLSVASFDAHEGVMTWLGVGNVFGVLLRPDGSPAHALATLLLRGGVVGSRLPLLRAEAIPVMPGDTLIFATDGVNDSFAQATRLDASPQRLAEEILARHAKGNDDALVLVARYTGGA